MQPKQLQIVSFTAATYKIIVICRPICSVYLREIKEQGILRGRKPECVSNFNCEPIWSAAIHRRFVDNVVKCFHYIHG
jgi:hypothetical protein